VKRAKGPAARERTPSVDEVRAILKAIDALVDEGKWLPVQGAAVRTLVFTGQRRQDVTEMRWEDLDLKAATWTQPAIRNKSKRLHSVPLIEPLLSMLKGSPRRDGTAKERAGVSRRALGTGDDAVDERSQRTPAGKDRDQLRAA
jgi:integrase